jgi:segregation and condensation protein B
MTLLKVLEALVFASPKPITTRELLAALKGAANQSEDPTQVALSKSSEEEVLRALSELESQYVASDRAFRLSEHVNGWNFITESSTAPWVRQLYPEAKPTRLTGPQLETLAIIAYRQPITRADIEAVRGVAVDGVMQVLLDRSLVKIAGRAELPGRPLLYRTTEYFLQHFGLKNTDDLPNAGELKRIVLPTAQPSETGSLTKTADSTSSPSPSPESNRRQAPVAQGAPQTTESSNSLPPTDPVPSSSEAPGQLTPEQSPESLAPLESMDSGATPSSHLNPCTASDHHESA